MPRLLSLLLLLAALLAAAGAQQEDYARLEMDSPASGSLLRGRVALFRLHVGERLADPLLLTLVSIEGDMDVLLLLSTTGEPLATPETADDVIDLVGSAARSNETSAYPLTAFGDEQVVIATEDIGGTGCRGPPCVVFVIVFAYDSGEFLLTLSSETDGAPLLSSTATVLDGGKEESSIEEEDAAAVRLDDAEGYLDGTALPEECGDELVRLADVLERNPAFTERYICLINSGAEYDAREPDEDLQCLLGDDERTNEAYREACSDEDARLCRLVSRQDDSGRRAVTGRADICVPSACAAEDEDEEGLVLYFTGGQEICQGLDGCSFAIECGWSDEDILLVAVSAGITVFFLLAIAAVCFARRRRKVVWDEWTESAEAEAAELASSTAASSSSSSSSSTESSSSSSASHPL